MTFSEILSLAPAFSEYTTQIPAELDGQFVLETFPPYGLIHQKDSPLRRIGILLRGSLRVINEFENGSVFMIECNDAVSFIGVITLFAEETHTSVTIEAVTECRIAFLPVPVFDAWLDSDPHFIKQMARHIAKKLYCSSYNRGERLFYSSSYLLLKYVAGEMEALGLRRMEKAVLRKNRRQISEELGMQEKTVNRTIARLCEEGVFSLERGKIAMTHKQLLQSESRLKDYSGTSRNGAQA